MIFGHDLGFWIAVGAAVILKLFTSPYHSFFRALMTIFSALFFAVLFTGPVVDWLGLDAHTYERAITGLLALTGEGFMRMVINLTSDSGKLADFINRIWRGSK